MYTKDKNIFILPSGIRVMGFDSLELMAKICNVPVVDFAAGYGTVVEKLMVSRLSAPTKDALTGKLEE
jgi:hypothetical protein